VYLEASKDLSLRNGNTTLSVGGDVRELTPGRLWIFLFLYTCEKSCNVAV